MIYIRTTLQEPKPCGEGEISNHIEREHLQPLSKVELWRLFSTILDETSFELIAENPHCGVNVRLKGDKSAH